MRALAPVIALIRAGCAAQMVNASGSTNANLYAPVNEATHCGVIRHLNEGAGFVKKRRGESA